MTDKQLEEGIENLKKNYIDAILTYLTTGVFSMPPGTTYIQAHTYARSLIRIGLYGESAIVTSVNLRWHFIISLKRPLATTTSRGILGEI